MVYIFAGGLTLLTPGPYRLFGVAPVLIAVFFYFYSTKTWAQHEEFWLRESNRKAGSVSSS
jgi:hypothetical protein